MGPVAPGELGAEPVLPEVLFGVELAVPGLLSVDVALVSTDVFE